MFQGLSDACNRILNHLAPLETQRFNHKVVQPEHILIALLKEGGKDVFNMLDEIIDLVHFQCILESHMDKITDEEATQSKNILNYYNISIIPQVSQRTKNVLLSAIDESRNYDHDYMDIFSLFLSCCADKQSIANVILMRHKLVLDDFRQYYVKFLKDKQKGKQEEGSDDTSAISTAKAQDKDTTDEFTLTMRNSEAKPTTQDRRENVSAIHEDKTESSELNKYCVDLTMQARMGKIPHIYGREVEIEKVFRILLRKQKNNPLLIGDAGVGKTAIVEELANKIVIGDAPLPLLDACIMELNLSMLTAGTRYRGDFEERFLNVLNEVVELSKERKTFLFIDEFHHIIGTGLATGLTMDAAGILKPALARGLISCIGATTFEEYRQHIETDKAFQRRVQTVEVNEMSEEATFLALQHIKKEYEEKHFVHYSDESLQEIVQLSSNHFFDRKLPDKAIDLLDEIGSYTSLQKIQPTRELRRLIQKESALKELLKYSGPKPAQHAQENEKDTVESQNKLAAITKERKNLQSQLIKKNENQYSKINSKIVREVVSKITGINHERLHGGNVELLANFERNMKKEVIGQEKAIFSIVSAVRRSLLGLRTSNKPIGSFIFLGPSGVGKTYTAKQLALQLYGSDSAFTRFDMSDYSEPSSINRLIGAPPGYVGFEDSGVLIKSIRRCPRQVLLFDEIEKADSKIYDIFLQILEEGILQGQRGEHADFRHSIIIFTSNLGSREIHDSESMGFSVQEKSKTHIENSITRELKKQFRPELINRFTAIVVFETLQRSHLVKIVDLMLAPLISDIARYKIDLKIDSTAKKLLLDVYYDKEYGARSIANGIRAAEDSLADALLQGKISEKSSVVLSARGRKFLIRKDVAKPAKLLTKKVTKKEKSLTISNS